MSNGRFAILCVGISLLVVSLCIAFIPKLPVHYHHQRRAPITVPYSRVHDSSAWEDPLAGASLLQNEPEHTNGKSTSVAAEKRALSKQQEKVQSHIQPNEGPVLVISSGAENERQFLPAKKVVKAHRPKRKSMPKMLVLKDEHQDIQGGAVDSPVKDAILDTLWVREGVMSRIQPWPGLSVSFQSAKVFGDGGVGVLLPGWNWPFSVSWVSEQE